MPRTRSETVSENGGPPKTARILVTDDQPEGRRLIERILGKQFDCESAESAAEARGMLADAEFDLAVCDIEMPGESGIVFGEELVTTYPEMALMFITATDDPRTAERAAELGAHGYLVKPFGRGQLLISTMNALRRRELEVAHRARERGLERRMQDIIDHAPLPIYVKDRDFRYVIANRSCRDLVDLGSNEVGVTDDDVMSTPSAKHARDTDRAVLEHGRIYEEEETLVVGDEERTFMTIKFPLRDDAGEIDAVCGISPDITPQREAVRLQEQLTRTQRRAIEELQESRLETVERLADAIELHDPGTGRHVHRMASIAALLGSVIGFEWARVELLRAAAPMHDVGKIGVREELLSKPGALTPDERKQMERHTEIGHALLAGSENALLQMAAEIAHTHHERFDGSGYPRGLAGEEIPIEGRVVAVADVFDALLSDRSYRPAMSLDEAVKLIREGKGSHFDPPIADALLENLDEAVSLRG
jgi:response regulator RpfG family c-di-GMP phosphodiesterase